MNRNSERVRAYANCCELWAYIIANPVFNTKAIVGKS